MIDLIVGPYPYPNIPIASRITDSITDRPHTTRMPKASSPAMTSTAAESAHITNIWTSAGCMVNHIAPYRPRAPVSSANPAGIMAVMTPQHSTMASNIS